MAGMDDVAHTEQVRTLYDRLLTGTRVEQHTIRVDGRSVNVLEYGDGDGEPVILLHGTTSCALWVLLPLLPALNGMRVIAPDRPGQGLSEPCDLPPARYREATVQWLDGLLNALGLDSATMIGHSAGGVWALWFALDRPARVNALAVIGSPLLPGTKAPLPFRMLRTPGLGALISRIPPTQKSMRTIAGLFGEGGAIERHPELIAVMVATGADPVAQATDRNELSVIVSRWALASLSGMRRRNRISHEDLVSLTMPTLVLWGDNDPVGSVATARAVADTIPDARLQIVAGGHAPFLDDPAACAGTIIQLARTARTPNRRSPS